MRELLEASAIAGIDSNRRFEEKYGTQPPDLLAVLSAFKIGLESYVQAESVSPPLTDPVYLSFTSAAYEPRAGEFLSVAENQVSFLDPMTAEPRTCKAKLISGDDWNRRAPKV
jgi:hypothetical protein